MAFFKQRLDLRFFKRWIRFFEGLKYQVAAGLAVHLGRRNALCFVAMKRPAAAKKPAARKRPAAAQPERERQDRDADENSVFEESEPDGTFGFDQ